MPRVTVEISDLEYLRLSQAARREHDRKAGVLRKALRRYLFEAPPVNDWAYRPVLLSLLHEHAPERLDDIHTQGELVQYLVGCKGWSHDEAMRIFSQ